ncbi:GLE1-like [Penicillium digitatum]|uniref:mRNA export factor GLE1 n=1 Tax=Penicillium digitatum TaxID=36651 RepID=A0A7T7BP21_PENDI|nr:GLE1-like [Penicillium digitatum]
MTRFRTHVPPLDSPSKQLMLDLVRDLEQVKIFDADLKKVHQYERIQFYENLDRIDREREAVHTAALDQAAAFHDRVREEAETTLKDHLLAEEEERLRKEEAIRKEQERLEREKTEKARREREAAARVEAERQAKEQAEKKAQEEAAKKAAALETARKAAIEEKLRKEREQADAQKRKQDEEARKLQEEADQKARSQQQQKLGAGNLSAGEIQEQQRYVELHKTLKGMRKWLKDIGQAQPDLKATMGNLRRSIKKSVGQLRAGTGANKQQVQNPFLTIGCLCLDTDYLNESQITQLKSELEKALAYPEPTVDIRNFIAFPPEEIAKSENRVPAMLIYGLNILAKSLISSLLAEASIKQSHAEPIGIIAAQIFSFDMFTYKGVHMSDIMWAKYRVVCPALWGFTGNDKTEGGRRVLGWWRSADTGSWITEQVHMDRMTALGAGYAAMTLRNFAKSPRRNPFPNTMFWASIHKILAISPSELQETQIALLAALLRSSGDRIIGFFGQYGLAMMHYVIVDLPRKLGRETMAVTQLSTLKELYLKEKNFAL